MIEAGRPAPLGATADAAGTNFAVFSSVADSVELCLFNEAGDQTETHRLPECSDGVWHGYLPGRRPGQHYGYRVHGPYVPQDGLRCNPAKLLIDPYSRALAGAFAWHDAVYDYDRQSDRSTLRISAADSAPFVPKSVVCAAAAAALPAGPRIPWSETIFYEANVRGYTMRHPALDDADRGTFDGMRHKQVLDYLRALGITSLELMPVHAFIDEQHLSERGLRNFWGYNTISFFAASPRYAKRDTMVEFRDMVRSVHDAGIEVILDVVYNHTGEGGDHGPSFCFRGLDNLAYYSTEPDRPGTYINDTGCGNTLNVDHPRVRQLVLDSLRYWHQDMGVDGFRFDLAPVLGRHEHGYSATHPMLEAIASDDRLGNAKLIAEPWDPGPGGYQLGQFPGRWAEWNDRYRDAVRKFWRGDDGSVGELAKRLHGSADLFEVSGRSSLASINLVTNHDGFTLADVVSYEHRHNHANGENNEDGYRHNYSRNHGIEGPTDDPSIVGIRTRQRLNLLATLLFSQGTPLLLGGDEFGHSQDGNNNAYAQDNETGWLDWTGLDDQPEFAAQIRKLISLRRKIPLLRLQEYVHGRLDTNHGVVEIEWLKPDGRAMSDHDWSSARAFCVVLYETKSAEGLSAAAILINGSDTASVFDLPALRGAGDWHMAFSSAIHAVIVEQMVTLPPLTISLLLSGRD